MKPITVDKAQLLSILEKNREAHREVFDDALEGWQKACIAELKQLVKEAQAGKKINRYLSYERPDDHTNDYDRVIGMLKMDQGDKVELMESDYTQYVMDDWGWKENWTTSNTMYMSSH